MASVENASSGLRFSFLDRKIKEEKETKETNKADFLFRILM